MWADYCEYELGTVHEMIVQEWVRERHTQMRSPTTLGITMLATSPVADASHPFPVHTEVEPKTGDIVGAGTALVVAARGVKVVAGCVIVVGYILVKVVVGCVIVVVCRLVKIVGFSFEGGVESGSGAVDMDALGGSVTDTGPVDVDRRGGLDDVSEYTGLDTPIASPEQVEATELGA
jgi:hypothetical protein